MDTFPRSFLSHVRTAPPGHYGSYLGCWSSYTIFLRVIWLPHHSCVVDYCTFCTTLVIVSFAACHSFNYSMGVCVRFFLHCSSVDTREAPQQKFQKFATKRGPYSVCPGRVCGLVCINLIRERGLIFANSCMACLPSMLVTFHVGIYNMAMYQTSKMFK